MGECFLSLDIGTSSVRAALFDEDGLQRNISDMEYELTTTADGRAEMDADLVFDCVIKVIRECVDQARLRRNGLTGSSSGKGESNYSVAGIGISCHMHSLMLVDDKGRPLTPLMTWADNRASAQAEFIASHYDVGDLYNRTGCRVQHPLYPVSKILWYKINEPDLFNKAAKFITIKEYLIFKLYGVFAVDYTLASCQGCYNIHTQNWDDMILHDILGISKDRFSDVVECTFTFKGFKKEYESQLGISRDTPLVIGSGDGIMANLGCGVRDDTSFSSTIGTSGAIRTAVSRPLLDAAQRTWCYSFTRDTWVAGGAINNGGIILRWLREEFRKQFEYDAKQINTSIYGIFDVFASETNPGSDGLIFLPYITGERSPDWNADVRGLMFGLSHFHNKKHIIRAAMEGVMFRLYSVFEVMTQLKNRAIRIMANGGYTNSEPWLQMQADIFNKEILVPEVQEASALGAAFLTMVALGAAEFDTVLKGMQPNMLVKPIAGNHEIYMKAYELSNQIYKSVYPNG
jgi:gluconokinase